MQPVGALLQQLRRSGQLHALAALRCLGAAAPGLPVPSAPGCGGAPGASSSGSSGGGALGWTRAGAGGSGVGSALWRQARAMSGFTMTSPTKLDEVWPLWWGARD
jgi:hypothetical protein